ncbi:MAG: TVP38/TMEM64 family protein [Clostridia bacterium]|nr:TVP38/TMEM64 family protein [Clostridia bacterium]
MDLKKIKILSTNKQERRQQIGVIVTTSLLILAFVVCYIKFGSELLAFISDADRFKAWLESYGHLGKIVFVAVRALQTVVKIIPAEPLEIGSGYAFGVWGGLLYCMLGTEIGSFIIVAITKLFGMKAVNLFVSEEKINSLSFLQNKEKLSISLFIIYLIPGTPKDVITYLIGVTDYNIWKFLLLTGVARIPSIITSTICGSLLGERNYWLSAGVFIGTAVLGLIGVKLYTVFEKKIAAKKA